MKKFIRNFITRMYIYNAYVYMYMYIYEFDWLLKIKVLLSSDDI